MSTFKEKNSFLIAHYEVLYTYYKVLTCSLKETGRYIQKVSINIEQQSRGQIFLNVQFLAHTSVMK